MTYYTYPTIGLGYAPDAGAVWEWETIEDAYDAFVGDVRITCNHKDTDVPADIPTLEDVRNAMPRGLVYGHAGWLHVVGQD